MRRTKKIIGLITILMLTLCFGSVAVQAENDIEQAEEAAVTFPIKVAGIEINTENAADVLGDGRVAYDPETKTLTLNGVNISVEKGNYGIRAEEELKIVLKGENKIHSDDYYGVCVVQADGNAKVVISGDGSLDAYGTDGGIYVQGALTMEDQVNITGKCGDIESGNAYGIRANGALTIAGDADVHAASGAASADSFALYAKGAMKICENASVTTQAAYGGNRSCGIYAYTTLEISENAVVNANGGSEDSDQSCGIRTTNMTINGGTVNAVGGAGIYSSYGIFTQTLDITGGTVNLTGGSVASGLSYGVQTAQSLTISGGTVTAAGGAASGESYGILSTGSLVVTAGDVTATSGTGEYTYGICADTTDISGGNICAAASGAADYSWGIQSLNACTISGGTVDALGGDAASYSYGIQTSADLTITGGYVHAANGTANTGLAAYAYTQMLLGENVVILIPEGGKVEQMQSEFMSYYYIADKDGESVSEVIIASEEYVPETKDAIILYTNDVHCAMDDYAELAAYAAQLEEAGHEVLIVDAGDAIQGEQIGTLTSGSAIIDIMNEVGYDYAVPGNHEFDYGMDVFLNLASEEVSDFEYLSSNFVDLRTSENVFDPYEIVELNGEKIAILGIATPESYTKSTPAYFQDENGEVVYGFSGDNFYDTIQNAIDEAVAEGAERVIAVGHLGIDGTTEGWKSVDVIANTAGIDVFLDAHAHEEIEGDLYENKADVEVLLSSTGTKFTYFGQLTLGTDGTEQTELISPESVDVDYSENTQNAYDAVQEKVDGYNSEIAYLYEVIGTAEVELTLNDADTGEWVIRIQETNMGDFVADAYRDITGADIAFINGGGVRAAIEEGDVTRKDLMDVNPWNNEMCVVKATGQQILDALEHGARLHPESCGGFLQVSGLSYEIHNYVESPVILDHNGSFVSVDDAKERRVKNVKVNGVAIDPEKEYTVAASYYMLKQGGDGFTMFADAEVMEHEGLPTDADMLYQYFTETLDGKITKEKYGNLKGAGNIVIYTSETDVPKADDSTDNPADEPKDDPADEPKDDPKDDVKENQKEDQKGTAAQTGDESAVVLYISLMVVSMIIICRRKRFFVL